MQKVQFKNLLKICYLQKEMKRQFKKVNENPAYKKSLPN